MAVATKYRLAIEAPVNGRVGKSTVLILDAEGKTVTSDRADLCDARERVKLANRLATKLHLNSKRLDNKLEKTWNRTWDRIRQERQEAERREKEKVAEAKAPEDVDQRAERLLAEMPAHVVKDAQDYLRDPALMHRIAEDIAALGVAGERRLGTSLYLVITSRLLGRPLAALLKGPTASGKSYIIETAARLFPPEAILVATSLTPNSLYYLEPGSLRHRCVVAGERSRNTREDEVADATRAMREMISAGRLSKLLPIKGEGGMETVHIQQEGPIAYVESTTRERIFDEDENRVLSLYTDERPEQTRRIIARMTAAAAGEGASSDTQVVIQRHHAVQRLLRRREIVIPYAKRLGELIPEERVEARRAVPHLLSMIQASALLHQFQREADEDGRIIATREDYEIARKLILGPLTRLIGSGLPKATERFLERMRKEFEDRAFTSTEARLKEKHSKAAVCGWLRELEAHGFAEIETERRGNQPARWRLCEKAELSESSAVLPTVAKVFDE